MDIELATVPQLIEELTKRPGFVGLIIHSSDEQRFEGQIHNDFVLTTTLVEEQTEALLDKVRSSWKEST
jgi:hypothetical protein